MRGFARAALGVVVLAALGALALTASLPRVLASEVVRARIAGGAEAELGRALRWQRLEPAWPPAELVMIEPRLAAAAPDAPPFAEAPDARLRLAAGSSLARPLWIDRVMVAGATLRLVDASVEPAVTWELRELAAKLRREAPDAPVQIEAAFALAGGGHAQARGSATRAGEIDLVVTLDAVELTSAVVHLGADAQLAGAVSGTLALAGPAARLRRVSAQLALDARELRLEQIALRGLLRVDLELAGEQGARSGRFELDATDADLSFGRSYRKPPGTPATVRGRIVGEKTGALGVDDVKLHIGEVARKRR